MKDIIVKIQFDENRYILDADMISDALQEYTKGDGISNVQEINFRSYYPQMIVEELSKVQPMPNDMRLLFPDLLKDFKKND